MNVQESMFYVDMAKTIQNSPNYVQIMSLYTQLPCNLQSNSYIIVDEKLTEVTWLELHIFMSIQSCVLRLH